MLTDPVEWAVDRLSDPVTGINAQLPNVPRTPGAPPPDPVTIYNELDHDWVARGVISHEKLTDENGSAVPILLVRALRTDQGLRVQPLPEYDQADPTIIPVEIVYARRKIASPTTTITVTSQIRDARQVIRTAMRVFTQAFDSSLTAIVRNGVTITLPSSGFLLNTQLPEPMDDPVIDTLIAPFRIRDPWALGM